MGEFNFKGGNARIFVSSFGNIVGASMNTNYDPFEKHRKLIEYLMLEHMSSFLVNTHLTSILGYSEILRKEVAGPLNEDQKQFLSIISNHTRYLHKHINTFITASRLLFEPRKAYLTKFTLSEIIDSFIEHVTRDTTIQIEKDIPDHLQEIEGDSNLIGYAFASIEEIIKQIHPAGQGNMKITLREEGNMLRLLVSANQEMSIDPGEENLDLFIVKSVAELHGGTFDAEYDSGWYHMTLKVLIQNNKTHLK